MWICEGDCDDPSAMAPACCTGAELSIFCDESDHGAELTDQWGDGSIGVPEEYRAVWKDHDCPPICSDCCGEMQWSAKPAPSEPRS